MKLSQKRAIYYSIRKSNIAKLDKWLSENGLEREYDEFRRIHKYTYEPFSYRFFFKEIGKLNEYYNILK